MTKTNNKKVYNGGRAISQLEYDKLVRDGKIDPTLLYLVAPKVDPSTDATYKWTSLSNAIINKYKPLVDTNPSCAVAQLTAIKKLLIDGQFLHEEDFHNWEV